MRGTRDDRVADDSLNSRPRVGLPRLGDAKSLRHSLHGCDQLLARVDRFALLTGPRTDAALPRPRGEIRVTLLGGSRDDRAFNPHLAMQVVPMDHRRGSGVLGELLPLARVVVRVEHEIAGLGHEILAQHDASAQIATFADGRDDHRIGIGLVPQPPGFVQPAADYDQGLRRQDLGQELGMEVHGGRC